jgi:hypothetical protein
MDCKRVLPPAQIGVSSLKHGDEQLFLAAEMIVEQVLVDFAAPHDLVHPSTIIALAGEFIRSGDQDPLPGTLSITDELFWRRFYGLRPDGGSVLFP